MKWVQGLGIVILFHCIATATAHEVAGVELEERAEVAPSGTPLVLNGAGVRRKFFFKVYVGALYLPERASAPGTILGMAGPKRVLVYVLYEEIREDKLRETWTRGFTANTTSEERAALAGRLQTFTGMFQTVKRGDVIRLDYLPDRGTQVWLNDSLQGSIPGADFHRALLKLWLGDRPADQSLQEAMLGRAP